MGLYFTSLHALQSMPDVLLVKQIHLRVDSFRCKGHFIRNIDETVSLNAMYLNQKLLAVESVYNTALNIIILFHSSVGAGKYHCSNDACCRIP